MTSLPELRAAYYDARPRELRLFVTTSLTEARSDSGGDSISLSGYASVTNSPYTVTDWLGDYTETIARGAFTKSLQDRDDVPFLVNHDGIPLARSSSSTLTLREIMSPDDDPQGNGQTGLWNEARIDGASPLAQTVLSAVRRGDMSQMSFAFQATRQTWSPDYSERTVNEVRLFDVSVVTSPANPATSIQANSANIASLEGRLTAARGLSDADRTTIREALAALEERHTAPEATTEADREALSQATALLATNQRRLDIARHRTPNPAGLSAR